MSSSSTRWPWNLDLVVGAAEMVKHAGGVLHRDVAGQIPAPAVDHGKTLRGHLGRSEVAERELLARDRQLARLAGRDGAMVRTEDTQLGAGMRRADRQDAASRRHDRRRAGLDPLPDAIDRGFGGAVQVVDDAVRRRGLPGADRAERQRLAAERRVAQRRKRPGLERARVAHPDDGRGRRTPDGELTIANESRGRHMAHRRHHVQRRAVVPRQEDLADRGIERELGELRRAIDRRHRLAKPQRRQIGRERRGRHHDALRDAGRARREDHVGEIVRGHRRRLGETRGIGQRVAGQDEEVGGRTQGRRHQVDAGAVDDHGVETVDRRGDRIQALARPAETERDVRGAGPRDGQDGLDRDQAARRENADAAAARHAVLAQGRREALRAPHELGVGEVDAVGRERQPLRRPFALREARATPD